MKWLWRYTEEDAVPWKEVIVANYGELNPWCTKITSKPYGSGIPTKLKCFTWLVIKRACLTQESSTEETQATGP
ncbi:hypothetical protein H5410_026576 [Solanum commersonii]|uniref:Uncharacterized protein n=1 Tax=Solanum commersonii TaxID=4109 RepID=A0A9J5Z130_SOLCO|nr:hypothetical protein H5410_026576 [Solanum commersonii]